MVESWCGFHMLLSTSGKFRRPWGDFQRVFRHLSKMIFLQCKDFKTSPDFCTPGVGRYVFGDVTGFPQCHHP